MRWSGTIGNVAEGVSQHPQIPDLPFQLVGPGVQLRTRNIRSAVAAEHACDLSQGEASRLPEADERQLQENVSVELPPQTVSPNGTDQADLLVIAQC
jgi:hypothetical protein